MRENLAVNGQKFTSITDSKDLQFVRENYAQH